MSNKVQVSGVTEALLIENTRCKFVFQGCYKVVPPKKGRSMVNKDPQWTADISIFGEGVDAEKVVNSRWVSSYGLTLLEDQCDIAVYLISSEATLIKVATRLCSTKHWAFAKESW